jgi:hypothetical protein
MSTVRVRFVDCGGHLTSALYPNFRLIPDLELAACDIQEHLGLEAFRRGYHVFTEKRTSLTTDGARRLSLPLAASTPR